MGAPGRHDDEEADPVTCPHVPGTRYEDWPVDDPKGQDLDTVRRIVDDLDARVRALLATPVSPGPGSPGGSPTGAPYGR